MILVLWKIRKKKLYLKTLISEVTNDYNIATAMVRLYIECKCYSTIPTEVKQNTLNKFKEALS